MRQTPAEGSLMFPIESQTKLVPKKKDQTKTVQKKK
jgi:hypothetical protein